MDFYKDKSGRINAGEYLSRVNSYLGWMDLTTLRVGEGGCPDGTPPRVLDTLAPPSEADLGLGWPNEHCPEIGSSTSSGSHHHHEDILVGPNPGVGAAGEPNPVSGVGGNCAGNPMGDPLGKVLVLQDAAVGCQRDDEDDDDARRRPVGVSDAGGTIRLALPKPTNIGVLGFLNAGTLLSCCFVAMRCFLLCFGVDCSPRANQIRMAKLKILCSFSWLLSF